MTAPRKSLPRELTYADLQRGRAVKALVEHYFETVAATLDTVDRSYEDDVLCGLELYLASVSNALAGPSPLIACPDGGYQYDLVDACERVA